MRIFLVLIILGLFSTQALQAQNLQAQPKKMSLTEKSIVKDSSGTVYPYAIWSKLIQSGNYSIKPVSFVDNNDQFILYVLTEKEKEEMVKRTPKPKESTYFVTGASFGKFKTTDINRNKLNLQEMKGKIVVFNFWFINCPPCKREIPELNKLVDKYKDRNDVVFIAVALDDKSDLKDFLKTTPFNYTIVDGGRWIASEIGINTFPTNVVVDQQGLVQFHATGYSLSLPSWIDKTIASLIDKGSSQSVPK
ncbi:TlpA disulfide reductase family protein [Sediminibacterium sp.]|uniref:TlpA family protein disulfide reductase n=1 Tax=Sediminibacterium sp. TaxID=1917865 RepID=UPI0027361D45|nr:TlpA disulfide reductase family protein [Sediminibacterium sp.]MDP3392291.1 TlpA disulfide reductase family protein [Sediminibacterium sp.]MDP3566907.1 TlpA disulfide reductase family protein [Sediminibacterium sp.]